MANATKPQLTRIHILRAGRFTDASGRDVTITLADLDELVSTYDPKRHEAPIVVGHPKTDAPAYGWTRGLAREGDGVYALAELSESFVPVVKGQHYKKVSSSFYLPGSVGNPTPGKRYLKHVGFLGAQPPAIKGLESIALASDSEDGAVSVELGEAETQVANLLGKVRMWLTDKFGQADADAALPEADIAALAAMSSSTPAAAPPALAEPAAAAAAAAAATPPPAAPATRFAVGATVRTTGAKQGKVVLARGDFVQLLMDGESEPRWFPATDVAAASTEQQPPTQVGNAPAASSTPAALAEREARVALAERRVGRERTLAWLDSLVRDGRPLPASREDIVSLFEALDSATTEVSFAEPGVKTPSDLLRSMLARSPRQVEFAEVSAGGGESTPADSRALARRAERIQAEAAKRGAPMSDVEAVQAAIKGE